MTAFLKLLKSIWDFILETLRDIVEWYRRPGSFLKTVCGVFAGVALWAGFVAYDKEQAIKRVNQEFAESRERCRISIEDRDTRLLAISQILDEERKAMERMSESNKALLEQFTSEMATLEQQNQVWKQHYETRDYTCETAIRYLDVACPNLGGY